MNIADGSPLYEPSQFVIDCGAFDHDAGPLRIRSRMARILHLEISILVMVELIHKMLLNSLYNNI